MFVEADPEPKTHVTCGMTHPIIVRWLEHRQVRRPHAQPMIGGRDLPIHPLAYLGPVIPAWSASQTYVELARRERGRGCRRVGGKGLALLNSAARRRR